MSIATQITRLDNAKVDIKTAIEAKGVIVPSSAKLDTYNNYISQLGGELILCDSNHQSPNRRSVSVNIPAGITKILIVSICIASGESPSYMYGVTGDDIIQSSSFTKNTDGGTQNYRCATFSSDVILLNGNGGIINIEIDTSRFIYYIFSYTENKLT